MLQAVWDWLYPDKDRQACWKKKKSIRFSLEGHEAMLPGLTTSSCRELFSFTQSGGCLHLLSTRGSSHLLAE